MGKVHSRSLVVDASIARAAGSEGAAHPTAHRCRACLLAIRDVCHRLVMTEAIREEWDEHQSRFTRRWLRSMFARRKVDRLDLAVDSVFRERVAEAAPDDAVAAIVVKDCHLIEAARAADRSVLALDDTVRDHFRRAASQVRELRDVSWVNPCSAKEAAIRWLEEGAPRERKRFLGAFPASD
jgi:ribonuclease D